MRQVLRYSARRSLCFDKPTPDATFAPQLARMTDQAAQEWRIQENDADQNGHPSHQCPTQRDIHWLRQECGQVWYDVHHHLIENIGVDEINAKRRI